MSQKLSIWGLRAICLGFVAVGLWHFLSPFILGVETAAKTFRSLITQAALIPLWPHPLVHIVIYISFHLFAIVFGLLGLFRLKAGWWGLVILTSFGTALFFSAFVKTYVLGVIIRYVDFFIQYGGFGLFTISTLQIDFLIRTLIYFAIFLFMFRDGTLNLFGISGMKKLPVVGSVLAINVILALMLYDFVR